MTPAAEDGGHYKRTGRQRLATAKFGGNNITIAPPGKSLTN